MDHSVIFITGQEELPLPDDPPSHLVDEGIQLNSVGSDSFRQDTSLASQRQNSLLDSSPSRRQGSPSLVGFSLRFKDLLRTKCY